MTMLADPSKPLGLVSLLMHDSYFPTKTVYMGFGFNRLIGRNASDLAAKSGEQKEGHVQQGGGRGADLQHDQHCH
jgi:hypothetical protein